MKILEITNYTAGGCGVGARVLQEAELLAERGHEVRIFSTNRVKGLFELASLEEKRGKVLIQRFPAIKLGGESFMRWNFKNSFLSFYPDVVIAHAYRHSHTTLALKLAKKINAKIFLVTHAPFDSGSTTRSLFQAWTVWMYDFWIGKRVLRKFDGVIAISKWEIPSLLKLGVPREKIHYVPNGIPKNFFEQKKSKEENKIIYFGRISPVKNIETLIGAFKLIRNKKIKLELVGPSEKIYEKQLRNLIFSYNLGNRVFFVPPIYEINEKITKIDSARVLVLPSKREGMPQALIEAMAREKIVIASDTAGAKDLIRDGSNGYLFPIGNFVELAKKIEYALSEKHRNIRVNASKSVEKFAWDKIIKKIEKLIVQKN